MAAVQASLSVLLVISYGAVAARLQLLSPASTRAVSKVCVRMFLPALLFTQIGAELHSGSARRYAVVLVWAFVCHAVSFAVGAAAHFLAGMPDWTTAAVMFNNTTSYPLLLIAALGETGILESLLPPSNHPGRGCPRRHGARKVVLSRLRHHLKLSDLCRRPAPHRLGARARARQ